MAVHCIEETILLQDGFVHAYKWFNDVLSARRIVILIHGLMMHGMVFDEIARHLANRHSVVVAPDLRGFGRSYFGEEDERLAIDYTGSINDVDSLLLHLRKTYSDIPVVVAGESLGAHLARSVIAKRSQQVAGLILSNPCIRPKMVSMPLIPYAVSQAMLTALDPKREINLAPFASRFLNTEPENLRDYLDDPMSRKSLDILELFDSMSVVASTQPVCIPAHVPILVLRGGNDSVCKPGSYRKFVATLEGENMTVHHCASCGHLVLQSRTVDHAVADKMCRWLEDL